jgi:hypothetical protein
VLKKQAATKSLSKNEKDAFIYLYPFNMSYCYQTGMGEGGGHV